MSHSNTHQNKAKVGILISYKKDFRAKNISRDNEGNFTMVKRLIHKDNLKSYAHSPNSKASNTKKKLIALQEK